MVIIRALCSVIGCTLCPAQNEGCAGLLCRRLDRERTAQICQNYATASWSRYSLRCTRALCSTIRLGARCRPQELGALDFSVSSLVASIPRSGDCGHYDFALGSRELAARRRHHYDAAFSAIGPGEHPVLSDKTSACSRMKTDQPDTPPSWPDRRCLPQRCAAPLQP
jgi:hypothetical protein